MSHQPLVNWKGIMFGGILGFVTAVSPVAAQVSSLSEEAAVRMDNRGPGSLNSGPGSLHSGLGRDGDSGHRGGVSEVMVAQSDDVRREDRRVDRREDRQLDRRDDRREDRRANTGGELRGLDRADQVAGEHGQQGRDNAREVQMMRANRPEQFQRPERVERPERLQRPERPEKPERPGRH